MRGLSDWDSPRAYVMAPPAEGIGNRRFPGKRHCGVIYKMFIRKT